MLLMLCHRAKHTLRKAVWENTLWGKPSYTIKIKGTVKILLYWIPSPDNRATGFLLLMFWLPKSVQKDKHTYRVFSTLQDIQCMSWWNGMLLFSSAKAFISKSTLYRNYLQSILGNLCVVINPVPVVCYFLISSHPCHCEKWNKTVKYAAVSELHFERDVGQFWRRTVKKVRLWVHMLTWMYVYISFTALRHLPNALQRKQKYSKLKCHYHNNMNQREGQEQELMYTNVLTSLHNWR